MFFEASFIYEISIQDLSKIATPLILRLRTTNEVIEVGFSSTKANHNQQNEK